MVSRGTVVLPNGCDKEKAFEIAKADERIASFPTAKNPIKKIYVPNKIINFVANNPIDDESKSDLCIRKAFQSTGGFFNVCNIRWP